MTMTDDPRTESPTHPATSAVEGPAGTPPPRALTGPALWLTTYDHKVVGRLYLALSLVFLLVGSAAGGVLGVERIDSGLQLVVGDAFARLHTLHGEVTVLLFLVPFFLGLATYLVPLQIGASDIAFPRGSATALWSYVVGGIMLLGAYAADGGLASGTTVGTDLYLLSLAVLAVSTCLALVSILTTAVTLRSPGMTMLRTPLFTWSMVVGGGLTLLATPVLLARLIELYIHHHFGADLASLDAADQLNWFWSIPQVYLLAVPAAGVAAEVVPVFTRSRLRRNSVGIAALGALGLLGFGAWAQVDPYADDLLYVIAGLAAVVPALALLGVLGDTVRRGRFVRKAPLLLALGGLVHLFLGTLAGAVQVIPGLELGGTVWAAAQVHYTLFGGAVLGAYAALWYWAPKIWGVHLGEGAGMAAFVLTFWGVVLLALPDLVSGLFSDRLLGASRFDDEALTVVLNVASAAGGALAALGVLVVVGNLLARVARKGGTRALADPWEGSTLEWATSSPPPPGNFTGEVPPVTSAWPVADQRAQERAVAPTDDPEVAEVRP
ncbi:MAG: cbb3-type cytochrome c oxidase subunit I [Actinobacteria bacterium]|nr:cbb3-type cytochrome c oxidase subunit I [Actinomycetota bacterium]